MKHLRTLLFLLALLLASTATPALANGDGAGYWNLGTNVYHHGMLDGPECGTRVWNAELTKGMENAVEVHVVHTVGCKTYDYTNIVGADKENMSNLLSDYARAERKWQDSECQRVGKLDTVNLFNYYWHTTVDPADVKVTCRPL